MAYQMTLRAGLLSGLMALAGSALHPALAIAQAPAQARLEVCSDQPDLRGLATALADSAAKMKGLDALMVEDAAAALSHYRALVAALCEQADAIAVQRDSATEGRTLALDSLHLCRADRAECWTELEVRVRKPVVLRKGRLFDCVVGPSVGASLDGEGFIGVTLTCGIPIF